MADNILSPKEVLQEYTQRFIEALQHSLQEEDRVVSAKLWQSIDATVSVYGQKVVMNITMEDYWKYVENGRKAGGKLPPVNAMLKHIADRGERWNPVAQRISKFRKNKKGLEVARKKSLNMDKARNSLAYLIGRSIAKRGIKPTHFSKKVMEGSTLIEEFQEELSKSVGREIEIQIELASKGK